MRSAGYHSVTIMLLCLLSCSKRHGECNLQCMEGFVVDTFLCECKCAAGPHTISQCEEDYHGSWNSETCNCDCPEGWTGVDCSEPNFGLNDVLTYQIHQVVDGEAVFVEEIALIEGNPYSFTNGLNDDPKYFSTSHDSHDFEVYFSGVSELVPGTIYTQGSFPGSDSEMLYWRNGFQFIGSAFEGEAYFEQTYPIVKCHFSFSYTNNGVDTLRVTQGYFQWLI